MAEKKANQLKDMLGKRPTRPAQLVQEVVREAEPASPAPNIIQGTPYQTGYQNSEVELHAEASQLSPPLQDIARRFVGARRRSGEALIEAARWLAEARSIAKHGEWYTFLAATGTTEDTATSLLNIHIRVMENADFAEAVRSNWLSPSIAGLLARPSTPSEVIDEALHASEPPKATEVRQKIRQAKLQERQPPQIPEIPGFEPGEAVVMSADQANALDLLREVADTLEQMQQTVERIPATREAEHNLARAEQALNAIRHALRSRG